MAKIYASGSGSFFDGIEISSMRYNEDTRGESVSFNIKVVEATDILDARAAARERFSIGSTEWPEKPELVCTRVEADGVSGSADTYVFQISFGPRTGSITLPNNFVKVSWSGGLITEHVQHDLDGKVIGSRWYYNQNGTSRLTPTVVGSAPVLDPDAEIGASVSIPATIIDVEMPVAPTTYFDPVLLSSLLGSVNQSTLTIEGKVIPPGYLYFEGYNSERLGIQYWERLVRYRFAIGFREKPTGIPIFNQDGSPFTENVITLRYGIYPRFYPVQENDSITFDPYKIAGKKIAAIVAYKAVPQRSFAFFTGS